MRVANSRPVSKNRQVVRRRRACTNCDTTYQTEERPRLWITRDGGEEPFLRGVLLASLRRVAAGLPVPSDQLSEVVRLVVVGMLAEGIDRPTADEVRQRTGSILIEQGLEAVAFRYDPSLNPDAFLVIKSGDRENELFDREKLKGSITVASAKFLPASNVEALVDEIEDELGGSSGPVRSSELRSIVSSALRRRDERAFLRYSLGEDPGDETLDQFLDRVAPSAQVIKRDGAVVLFDGSKLAKSIHLSFVADRRDEYAGKVAEFVAGEERRVREKLATDSGPDSTADLGKRVMEWLFDLDERAWANYWIAFEWDHKLADGSPTIELAKAREEMRRRREKPG